MHDLVAVVECLSTCLTPILQCVERNAELISCFEAVRQLSIKIDSTPPKVCVGAEDGRNVKNSLCRRDDIAEQINFYTQTELAHIFEQPKVLESFARREAERVEDLLKDSQSIMKYDRFQVVMNGLMEAVKAVLQFFPDKTLPICVSRWKVALVQSLTFFQPAPHTHQTELLERLSALRKIVQQLLLSTQKMCEDYVKSAEVRRLRPTEVESINSQLSEQLWRPLNNVLVICAAECQQAIKQTVIAPVIATADGYESQPLWRLQSSNGGSAVISNSVLHTPLHLAPSEMVRGFGEAIVEIPLALESLRGGSEGRFDGIEELLEEVTEYWLDDIVRTAVSDFIESKVANIIMCFPLNSDDAAALAVEQLVTDLSYLKSILAAVSDDPFERLESVLSRLKTASIKSGSTIAIRELIAEQGQSKE